MKLRRLIVSFCLLLMILAMNALVANASELKLPEDVTTIETKAFYGLPEITSVYLPDGVQNIGDLAFGNCENLQVVSVSPNLPGLDDLAALSARILGQNSNATIAIREDEDPGNFEYEVVSGHVVINGWLDDENTECIIPSVIAGLPVTEIGNSAFYYNTRLRKVVIPAGVTTIGNRAFYNCSYLTNITFPTTLTTVGAEAFYRCGNSAGGKYTLLLPDGITSIGDDDSFDCYGTVQCKAGTETVRALMDSNCPGFCIDNNHDMVYKGVTYNGKKELFLYKYNGDKTTLTSITIPEGVVGIYANAMSGCRKLTALSLPSTIRKLESKCFYQLGKDCQDPFYVSLPDNLEEINLEGTSGSFFDSSLQMVYECKPNTTIARYLGRYSVMFTAPGYHDFLLQYKPAVDGQSVQEWPLYLMHHMGSEEHVVVPNGVEIINSRAFCTEKYNHPNGENTTMKDVTLPDSMIAFEGSAFRDCKALQSIDIPTGFTEIPDYTFLNCVSLTQVTFPATLTKIGSYAFEQCGSASQETFYYNLPDHITGSSYKPFYDCKAVLVTGKNSDTAYWLAGLDDTGVRSAAYDFTVTGELDYRFRYKNVQVDGVNTPRLYLTQYVGTSTIADILSGPIYIDKDAFKNKTNLTKAVIPEGVVEIGLDAFSGCTGLTDITFPQTLKVLKGGAFRQCGSASDETHYYILPDTMTEINNNTAADWGAFGGLNKGILVCSYNSATAKLLSDPDGGNGGYNFAPRGHQEDGLLYRYERHDDEDRLYLWDYIRTDQAEIIIPDDIGLYGVARTPPGGSDTWHPAFQNHTEITKVVIPEGVRTIEESAFRGCTMLTDITLPSTLKILKNHTFERVGKAADKRFIVVLPAALEEITAGDDAGWDTFNDSPVTLVALNNQIRGELYDGWYYYYESLANAQSGAHVKYKESSDPNQKYRGSK